MGTPDLEWNSIPRNQDRTSRDQDRNNGGLGIDRQLSDDGKCGIGVTLVRTQTADVGTQQLPNSSNSQSSSPLFMKIQEHFREFEAWVQENAKRIGDEFNKFEQTGDLDDYNESFEDLRAAMLVYNPAVPEDYFISRYISGLKSEIRPLVKLGRPIDLAEAMNLSRLHYEAVREWIPDSVLVEESASTWVGESAPQNPEIGEEALSTSSKVHSCPSFQDEIVEVAPKELKELVWLLIELMEIRLAHSQANSIEFVRVTNAHKVFVKMPIKVVESVAVLGDTELSQDSCSNFVSMDMWLNPRGYSHSLVFDPGGSVELLDCEVCECRVIGMDSLQSLGHGYIHSAGLVYSNLSSFEPGDTDFVNPITWPFDRGKIPVTFPRCNCISGSLVLRFEVFVISVFDSGKASWCGTWSNSMQGIHDSHPRGRAIILVYDPGGLGEHKRWAVQISNQLQLIVSCCHDGYFVG